MLNGGCYCGQVRYETDAAPFNETVCHCTDCRRAVGAQAVAWFSVPRGSVRWTGSSIRFRSSPAAFRRFCPNCGTSLTWEGEEKTDEIDIAAATLDDPAVVAPKDHVFAGSRVGWDVICDGLPAYERQRSGKRVG